MGMIQVHTLLPVTSGEWISDYEIRVGRPTNGFTVPSFPSPPKDLHFLLAVSGLVAETTLNLCLRRRDGSPSSVPPVTYDLPAAPHQDFVLMALPTIRGVVFEQPGMYPIDVVVRGVSVHRYPLMIAHNHPENENAYPLLR